jgi:hypothetical protein
MEEYIDREYERIYGRELRKALYSESDSEYNSLRAYIMAAPQIEYDKFHLPFEGLLEEKVELKNSSRSEDLTFLKGTRSSIKKKKDDAVPQPFLPFVYEPILQDEKKVKYELIGQIIGNLLECNSILHNIFVTLKNIVI